MTATDAGGGIPEVSRIDVPAGDEPRSAPPHGTIRSAAVAAVEAGPDPGGALAALLRGERRRVLATVIRLTGDLHLAEDAVQDAAVSALETWRRIGVPPNPRAWLTLAAKRRVIDLLRREGARPVKEREAIILAVQRAPDDTPPGVVRDDQLRLIFTCCHPALAQEAQVALSLHVLCGLSVAEVARALLVSEATMAKRLTRARRKIADAGIRYRVPDAEELPGRLGAVATTVFLLFTEGYASRSADAPPPVSPPPPPVSPAPLPPGPAERAGPPGASVAEAAIRLGRLLVELMPGEPVLEGLLATMLLQHSRLRARFDDACDIVLLADQDRSLWDTDLAAEGIELAASAIRGSSIRPERFAVTAAIAACHALAADAAATDWNAVLAWYDVLLHLDPSPVVRLNRAAALAESGDPAAALAVVDRIEGLDDYFWFHATRAELLRRLGRDREAGVAAVVAAGLTESAAQRRLLARRHPL
ncbi:RNA polymerase sigma factor [Cryobacterium zhongshanensis]|uniref:Sigma-70 family RNA polymerase sigma factor n=1 Tax=Cryobacterium zhongshanensis TaxID=2928153 RepID=A0AA41UFC7_9MICO|nr:sigma-70 family RNA polymerase sigma factor [Cryobacterium zhongshanensis]MCI4657952.1 sigma-70 family RNA polymerase sigma factor [Cryobacterium zhongshanensis]